MRSLRGSQSIGCDFVDDVVVVRVTVRAGCECASPKNILRIIKLINYSFKLINCAFCFPLKSQKNDRNACVVLFAYVLLRVVFFIETTKIVKFKS